MSYSVLVLRRAQKNLTQVRREDYTKISHSIRALADEPRPDGCLKLTGRDGWRLRVGGSLGSGPAVRAPRPRDAGAAHWRAPSLSAPAAKRPPPSKRSEPLGLGAVEATLIGVTAGTRVVCRIIPVLAKAWAKALPTHYLPELPGGQVPQSFTGQLELQDPFVLISVSPLGSHRPPDLLSLGSNQRSEGGCRKGGVDGRRGCPKQMPDGGVAQRPGVERLEPGPARDLGDPLLGARVVRTVTRNSCHPIWSRQTSLSLRRIGFPLAGSSLSCRSRSFRACRVSFSAARTSFQGTGIRLSPRGSSFSCRGSSLSP